MIQEFVKEFEKNKHTLESRLSAGHPRNYKELVTEVIELLGNVSEWDWEVPDPRRIHEIDDGDYQGTLVYIIGAKRHQPSDYWYVKISYGSCSGCDSLQAIQYTEYTEYTDKPNKKQLNMYMTLALHIIQGMHKMGEEVDELERLVDYE